MFLLVLNLNCNIFKKIECIPKSLNWNRKQFSNYFEEKIQRFLKTKNPATTRFQNSSTEEYT